MNIYIRYFDNEAFVSKLDEAFDFLQSLPDVDVDEYLRKDLTQYINGNVAYPKRYKVHGRNYFIVIKTNAATMEDFKAVGNSAREAAGLDKVAVRHKSINSDDGYMPGWYDGSLMFKRVIPISMTQKFQYVDTLFAARVKAVSRQDCYNKIIDHLRSRQDIDPRSQFPSARGRNFECHYRGVSFEE